MSEFLKVCVLAARAGGEVLLDWVGRFEVREKAPMDLVTEADLASQATIRRILLEAFPDHGFVGEEDRQQETPATAYRWIVDPLDGTVNYVHGVPHYATSVALERDGQLLVAAVYDPMLDECFTGAAGEGAWLGKTPLLTSTITNLSEAAVAASFPPQVDLQLPVVREFLAVLEAAQVVRRTGSAALNLAYLAAGRYDAFWAYDLYPWDAAAGVLLIQEAGGIVTAPDGGPFDVWNPKLIAAAGPTLYAEFSKLLANA